MNVITDTLRQLVRRKLWPVALLLVGALVAVPLVLAKEPEADPVARRGATPEEGRALPATFVAAADEADRATTKRRRVLGAAKDPFEPAALPKAKKKKKKPTADVRPSRTDGRPPTDDTPSPAGLGRRHDHAAGQRRADPDAHADDHRPGVLDQGPLRHDRRRPPISTAKTVERLSVLPDEENPVLVYRGVEDGGKVAIFELTGDVDAQGDGECAPTPEDCQYLKLRAGETEFITVDRHGRGRPTRQYQLDLVKIYKKATKEKLPSADARPQSLAKASSTSLKGKACSCGGATATSSTPRRARCTWPGARRPRPPLSNHSRREPMKCARRALGPAAAR